MQNVWEKKPDFPGMRLRTRLHNLGDITVRPVAEAARLSETTDRQLLSPWITDRSCVVCGRFIGSVNASSGT